MARLSVLIPARNEAWLAHTVADVLEHSGPGTDVIVVLDGAWPLEPVPQHPRVQILYLPESVGQRAATNLAARISDAEFICKVDAHCSVAPGWDVALIDAARELGRETVQVPAQHNLHVFDWICDGCGRRSYQGPTPTDCPACHGAAHHREMVWRPRRGVRTTAWRFDSTLKFQYWGEFTKRPEGRGELTETLSCLGACWFLDRAWFWELGGLDERHGSWGQMGTEIACKAWLSGGRLICNQRTWFAHLFRTQGGDFGFPYPLSGAQVDQARAHSRRLWLEGGWPKAVRPLSWLLEHFAPVPDWPMAPAVQTRPTAGLVYYTDNRGDPAILEAARTQLTRAADGRPIVSVALQPIAFGDVRLVLDAQRGYLTMFRQILAGLEALETNLAFLVEHDVLYHPSHFEHVPARDTYAYNLNVWKVHAETGHAIHYQTKQTSGLCADRRLLLAHYRERVARVERDGFSRRMGFEPGSHRRAERVDDVPSTTWWSLVPNVDIRHGHNLTQSRWSPAAFRDQRNCRGWTESDGIPGWGQTEGRFAEWLAGLRAAEVAA